MHAGLRPPRWRSVVRPRQGAADGLVHPVQDIPPVALTLRGVTWKTPYRCPAPFQVSSARLSSSTFTRGSPRNPNCRPCVCCGDERAHASSPTPRARATRAHLVLGRGRADVRIEAAADAVTRSTGIGSRVAGVRGAQRVDARLHRVVQRRIQRPLIRAGGRAGVVGDGPGGRRTAPEILRVAEGLPDQPSSPRSCRRSR